MVTDQKHWRLHLIAFLDFFHFQPSGCPGSCGLNSLNNQSLKNIRNQEPRNQVPESEQGLTRKSWINVKNTDLDKAILLAKRGCLTCQSMRMS